MHRGPEGPEAGSIGTILLDPRDSDTPVVSSMQGGITLSTDCGMTWQSVCTIPGDMVMSISQSWEEPDAFYAATGRQVLKTTDGGQTWRPTGDELPGVSVVAVAPNDQRIVYAGVLEGNSATIHRSNDGGKSWEAQN